MFLIVEEVSISGSRDKASSSRPLPFLTCYSRRPSPPPRARPRIIKVPTQPTHPPSGRPSLMHNAALHIPDANINNVGSGESGSGCDQRVKTLMAALGS